jgi:hypothetical protein
MPNPRDRRAKTRHARTRRPSRPAPERSARLWIEFAVSWALTIFLASAVIAATVNGTRDRDKGLAVGIVVLDLVLFALCARWALHCEHRLRGGHPPAHAPRAQPVIGAAAAPAAAAEPAAATSAQAARASGLQPRPRGGFLRGSLHSPVGLSLLVFFLVTSALASVAGAIDSHGKAVRSSFVQHHGTPADATVSSVHNIRTCYRRRFSDNYCDYSAEVVVTLNPSVDGVTRTTVHYPHFAALNDGDTIAVLVDPKQPDYAELPGQKDTSPGGWIALTVLALILGGFSVREALILRRLLASRRARAEAGGAAGSANPLPS